MKSPSLPLHRALVAVALACCASGLAQAHPPVRPADDGNLRTEVAAYYAGLRDAVAARDAAALKAMYEARFTHTHGSGRVDGRDARIVSLLSADPTVEMRTDHALEVELHGTDVAIVRGKGPILNAKENRDYDFRWVQVLLRQGGRWTMAVSQATRLPEPPAQQAEKR